MIKPALQENQELLEKIAKEIAWHEDFVEECSCDNDYGTGNCWYYLSDKDQKESRLKNLLRFINTELEELND